jgi:hypothetical protein
MDIFVGGLRNPDGHGNSGRKVHPITEAKDAAAAPINRKSVEDARRGRDENHF